LKDRERHQVCSVLLAFLESTSRRSNRIVAVKDEFASKKEKNQETQSPLDQWRIRVSSLDRLTARGCGYVCEMRNAQSVAAQWVGFAAATEAAARKINPN
jgi:hypothetical protein